MYLNLGQSVVVRAREILGVFDLDHTTYSAKAARFINDAQRRGRVIPCTDDLPRSMIVCDGAVYLSPYSTATLQRRLETESWNND